MPVCAIYTITAEHHMDSLGNRYCLDDAHVLIQVAAHAGALIANWGIADLEIALRRPWLRAAGTSCLRGIPGVEQIVLCRISKLEIAATDAASNGHAEDTIR